MAEAPNQIELSSPIPVHITASGLTKAGERVSYCALCGTPVTGEHCPAGCTAYIGVATRKPDGSTYYPIYDAKGVELTPKGLLDRARDAGEAMGVEVPEGA